ncbi:MAG: MraY family glycosyltransferase [Planctomycetota bacterium]|nr:MraY family glycosyltransferase [Planctomycetota bacterium]
MIVWAGVAAFVVGALVAGLATPVTRTLAYRLGMMDMPGRHKGHKTPVPLLGGCAIYAAVALPSVLAAAVAAYWGAYPNEAWPGWLAIHVPGAARKAPLAVGILAAAGLLHALGLRDDRRALGPVVKLIGQVLAAAFVVFVCNVRILTALEMPLASDALTILWLVTITNAFNFLDNMDGLSAGVALICCAALLGAAAAMGQIFVAVWICLLGGALAGFLPYNFHPARTYMGDAGSMVVGFLLGVLSCLTTYTPSGSGHDWRVGAFVPVVLMSLPLYDMASVIILRLRERRNPMVGDRRHFSHRLLQRGMSVRTAVLTIYLCTAATAIAATLLPQVAGGLGAVLVLAQTVLIVLVLAILEFGDRRP